LPGATARQAEPSGTSVASMSEDRIDDGRRLAVRDHRVRLRSRGVKDGFTGEKFAFTADPSSSPRREPAPYMDEHVVRGCPFHHRAFRAAEQCSPTSSPGLNAGRRRRACYRGAALLRTRRGRVRQRPSRRLHRQRASTRAQPEGRPRPRPAPHRMSDPERTGVNRRRGAPAAATTLPREYQFLVCEATSHASRSEESARR
jgi:hypothetical protein